MFCLFSHAVIERYGEREKTQQTTKYSLPIDVIECKKKTALNDQYVCLKKSIFVHKTQFMYSI